MATQTATLVQALEQFHILDPAQMREVTQKMQGRFPASAALAGELVKRGWLTSFQVDKLLQGRGRELQLGPYLVQDRLGAGGAGEVYKARLHSTGKVVALKVLRKEMIADAEAVARFQREMEVASQLRHPCIVRASDAGQVDAALVLEMEYLEGIDLEALVKKSGPLPIIAACDYIRQAALGLQHAHKRGLIHRDIKPANLFICKYKIDDPSVGTTPYGLVKIFDMGLARLTEPPPGSQTKNLTQMAGAGIMQGTPDYMAPEQAIDFHSADIRSDIYSLGCVFYFILTGKTPFSGTLAEKLIKHQQAMPPPVEEQRAHVTPTLAAIVKKMIAKRPLDRFQNPGDVASVLAKLMPSIKGQRKSKVSAGASGEFMLNIPGLGGRKAAAGPGNGSLRRRGKQAGIALLCIGLLAAAAFWWFNQKPKDPFPTSPATNTLSKWTPPTSVGPSTPVTTTKEGPKTKTAEGWLIDKPEQAIEVPHGDTLEPAQLTLSAWIKLPEFKDGRRWIVSKNENEWKEGHFALVLEGRKAVAYLNIGNGMGNVQEIKSGDIFQPNRWHHLALTYDGSFLRGYVDGNQFSAKAVNKARVPGNQPLVIGRRPDNMPNSFVQARLDDIRLYNRALSAQDIKSLFDNPDQAAKKGEGGLVYVWP